MNMVKQHGVSGNITASTASYMSLSTMYALDSPGPIIEEYFRKKTVSAPTMTAFGPSRRELSETEVLIVLWYPPRR